MIINQTRNPKFNYFIKMHTSITFVTRCIVTLTSYCHFQYIFLNIYIRYESFSLVFFNTQKWPLPHRCNSHCYFMQNMSTHYNKEIIRQLNDAKIKPLVIGFRTVGRLKKDIEVIINGPLIHLDVYNQDTRVVDRFISQQHWLWQNDKFIKCRSWCFNQLHVGILKCHHTRKVYTKRLGHMMGKNPCYTRILHNQTKPIIDFEMYIANRRSHEEICIAAVIIIMVSQHKPPKALCKINFSIIID